MNRKWTHERITRRNKMLSQFIHLIHMERLKKEICGTNKYTTSICRGNLK